MKRFLKCITLSVIALSVILAGCIGPFANHPRFSFTIVNKVDTDIEFSFRGKVSNLEKAKVVKANWETLVYHDWRYDKKQDLPEFINNLWLRSANCEIHLDRRKLEEYTEQPRPHRYVLPLNESLFSRLMCD